MEIENEIYEKAKEYIPGGVNSPVRAFNGVGGTPVFFSSGQGPYLTAENGRRYIDYVCSWGPLILGHAHPAVIQAVQQTIKKGLSFGAPTRIEVELAELVCELVPSLDMVLKMLSPAEVKTSVLRTLGASSTIIDMTGFWSMVPSNLYLL